jgi:hypothetical protein
VTVGAKDGTASEKGRGGGAERGRY